VFCASSESVDAMYNILAKNLAEKIVETKKTLVFGGSNLGMMRIMAETVHLHNGKMIGVIPQRFKDADLQSKLIPEIHVTPDMNSRKAKMAELADAFIALPGGFGTLEELSEVITAKYLRYHNKPIVIINTNGFYDKLIAFFEHLYKEKFARTEYKSLYYICTEIEHAWNYIEKHEDMGTQSIESGIFA